MRKGAIGIDDASSELQDAGESLTMYLDIISVDIAFLGQVVSNEIPVVTLKCDTLILMREGAVATKNLSIGPN